jgi:HK97 family phage prohead protease
MNKIFNVTSTFKSHENDDGSVMIRGMASTDDSDRAGDVISAEAWAKGGLESFKNNPVILFNHDYDKPIGRAVGVNVTERGLELEAKISKSAPAAVCELVKDGVLGAFSVGFRIKDADYIKETDGLMIKDAELFEVSVVSVPCNQAATFSLAKSFDSETEYEEFKKTFTNRADLASQSLAKEEANVSNVAREALEKTANSGKTQENTMDDNNIDLEAFAKKVAEETATKIAMKQAEQKAAEKAEAEKAQADAAEKAAQDEQVKTTIKSGIETGAERLQADLEKEFAAAKDADVAEIAKKYEAELKEKADELEAMRNSKATFTDRSGVASGDLKQHSEKLFHAHLLGIATGKGWNTDFARDVQEKAGITYTGTAGEAGLDLELANFIGKEIAQYTRVADLFQKVPVNSARTTLPLQPDVNFASWGVNDAQTGNLTNNSAGDAMSPTELELTAYRLISQSYIQNDVDEAVLIPLLPMLVDGVARAHARKVEANIVGAQTASNSNGFAGLASGSIATAGVGGVLTTATARQLMAARGTMGKYAIEPGEVAYIVNNAQYYALIEDDGFADITDVGDQATKIKGQVGMIYGSPVVVSAEMPAYTGAAGDISAYVVNTRNFLMPTLRGVRVEQDYEVGAQRRVVVATQSLGFNQTFANVTGHSSAVKVVVQAS